MQTKRPILSSPKVIKNYFLLYYSQTPKNILQAIYQKALTLIESPKGFYISSDILMQKQQLLYLALIHHGFSWERYEKGKLLKNELTQVMHTMSDWFGFVDFANTPKIHNDNFEDAINMIAKEVNIIFIESFIIDSREDIASLQQIKELAHALSVRIEVGVNCDIKWLPELQALTTNRCVLL